MKSPENAWGNKIKEGAKKAVKIAALGAALGLSSKEAVAQPTVAKHPEKGGISASQSIDVKKMNQENEKMHQEKLKQAAVKNIINTLKNNKLTESFPSIKEGYEKMNDYSAVQLETDKAKYALNELEPFYKKISEDSPLYAEYKTYMDKNSDLIKKGFSDPKSLSLGDLMLGSTQMALFEKIAEELKKGGAADSNKIIELYLNSLSRREISENSLVARGIIAENSTFASSK